MQEFKPVTFGTLEIKEEEQDYHVSGWVATSHPDRAASEDGKFAGDIIPKTTLQKIVEQINNRSKPEAGAGSYRHDWIKLKDPSLPLAGAVVAPATLKQTPDGEWGAWIDTVVSKTHPKSKDIISEIQQSIIPGFSIEYNTKNFAPVVKEGKTYRALLDLDMKGWGFANRRMIANPNAQIVEHGYKEVMTFSDSEEIPQAQTKEQGEQPMEKTTTPAAETPATAVKEHTVSAEDMALLTQIKEQRAKEAKNTEYASMKESIMAEVKEAMKKSSPLMHVGKEMPEMKEVVSFKEAFSSTSMKELTDPIASKELGAHQIRESKHKQLNRMQYKEAAKLATALVKQGVPIMQNFQNNALNGYQPGEGVTSPFAMKEMPRGDPNGVPYSHDSWAMQVKEFGRIEAKGLDTASNAGSQTDTNLASASWTYGSYYLSPVEMNDIFQPAIVNQLNDRTTTFGILQKEDWSGYSQIQFRARTGRNSTAGGYLEGANLVYGTDFSGQVGRDKFQQPFSYYRVLVALTGQAQQLAMAPGGIGDRWAREIEDSTKDLLRVLNLAIIGTGAGSAENVALGFETLIQGTTGTLYGKNIATYTTLQSHKETLSSVRITIDQLRKMIRLVQTGTGNISSNADVGNLVFICNHIQEQFIKSILQDMQRLVPTSGRVGFEGRVDVDGVPVFTDRLVNTDDLFLIDLSHTKLAMNLAPTLMPLPVTADAQAAMVKTYFNLYSDAPANNYWTLGLATS